MADFGEILKNLRQSKGITQQQLAERLGISKTSISYYEQSIRPPSLDILIKLSGIFHVSADFLLGLDQKTRTINVSDLTEKIAKSKKSAPAVWFGLIFFGLMGILSITTLFQNFFIGFSFLAISGLVIAVLVLSLKKQKERKDRLPVIQGRIIGLQNKPSMSWLPMDYRDSFSAYKIIEYLTNMRANTLQEAINLLETEKHQAAMEAIAAVGAINSGRYF